MELELELVKDGSSMMDIPVVASVPDFSKVKARVCREELKNSNFLTIETGSPTPGQFFIDIQLSDTVSGNFAWNLLSPRLDNFSVIVESQLGGGDTVTEELLNSVVKTIEDTQMCMAVVGPTVLLQITRLRLQATFSDWASDPYWGSHLHITTACRLTSLFVPEYSWPVFGGLFYTAFQFRRESPVIRVQVVSFPFNSDADESFPQQARVEISIVLKKHTRGAIEFMKISNDDRHFSQEISLSGGDEKEEADGGTVKRVFHERTKLIVYLNASAPPPPRHSYHLVDFVVLGENELGQFKPINYVET